VTFAKLWPIESAASAGIAVRGDKVGRLALELIDVGGKRRLVVPPKAPFRRIPSTASRQLAPDPLGQPLRLVPTPQA
jgi:hypothetical protein